MNIEIAYGKEGLAIDVPNKNLVKILRMNEKPVVADPAGEVMVKLGHPIGTPPLAELAKGRKTVCIVVSDITRPVPNAVILPPMLEVLERAGVPREGITILNATGLHRPNEGDELVALLGPDIPNATVS